MEDKEFTYLLEAYKVAVSYFSDYSTRVSNRFNVLLAIDIALAGVYGAALFNSNNAVSGNGAWLISTMGLIISILLYVQSAQDKFIVKRHLKRINTIRQHLENYIHRNDIPALFSPLDETDTGERRFIFEGITSWRSNFISLTRVPPVTSLVFVAFWIVTIFIRP